MSIPSSKIMGDEEQIASENEKLFEKVAKRETQLQLNVEHHVLVHKNGTGRAVRQRKGEDLRLFTRKISLLDAAAHFLNGITGGDRLTPSSFSLSYSKKSLKAIVILAAALRDLIERFPLENGTMQNCSIAPSDDEPSSREEFQALYNFLMPNNQMEGRAYSRILWSVSLADFEQNHIEPPRTNVDVGQSSAKSKYGNMLGPNYLLDDDDDESDDGNRNDRPCSDDDDSQSPSDKQGVSERGAGQFFDGSQDDSLEDDDHDYVEKEDDDEDV